MASIASTAHITGDDSSTEGRARRLYAEILADVHSKGVKSRSTPVGIGYMWSGNLSQMAARCWPGLTIEPGRTGPASKQFLEVIKKYLRDSKNVVWVQERGQFYVSPEYKEARVKKTAKTAVLPADSTLAQESITDRAKRIWERARQYCEQVNADVEVFKTIEFYNCDKPLAFFVKAEFPELCMPAMQTEVAFEKYRRPFYDLLRATTNAVNVGSKYFENMADGEHHWLIRKDWHSSHEAFNQVFDFPADEAVIPAPARLYSVQPLLLVIGTEIRRKPTAQGDKVTIWKVVHLPKDGPVVLEGISGPGLDTRLPISTDELARDWEVIVQTKPAPKAPKAPKVKPEPKPVEKPKRVCAWKDCENFADPAVEGISGPFDEWLCSYHDEFPVPTSSITPRQSLDVLGAMVRANEDLVTENEMLESEVERLRTENEALQVGIEEAKSGNTVIELVEEVLASIYEGSIGISRAIADVEDIIRTAKSPDGS